MYQEIDKASEQIYKKKNEESDLNIFFQARNRKSKIEREKRKTK